MTESPRTSPRSHQPADSLSDLATVVRHVLAARTRDHHLIEDLTQETLIRLTSSKQRLTPEAQLAYAIVTARNLLTSDARRQSVRRRHLHRLVEDTGHEGPEQDTLRREETDALTVALERIDPEDRDLLLRHDSQGDDLATLADQAHVSSGAIAMRLTRARAVLRLEFVLAFRHIELPTERCRPVLLALATGDRRRQEALDVAAHLETCQTCAALAKPLTERNRRIAAWLVAPVVESIRHAWRRLRGRPIYATAAIVLASVTLVRPEAPNALPPTAVDDPPSTTTVGVPPFTTVADPAFTTTVGIPPSTAPTAPITVASTTETTAAPGPATTMPTGVGSPTASTAPCILPTVVDPLDPATDLVCPVASIVVGAAEEITTATVPDCSPCVDWSTRSGRLGPWSRPRTVDRPHVRGLVPHVRLRVIRPCQA